MHNNSPICFLDTETTGLHPNRQIWEIAMIRREPSGDESQIVIQNRDVNLSEADPFALKINGFYERYWTYSPTTDDNDYIIQGEASLVDSVEHFTKNAHIVGAVPHFDTETLDKLFRKHGLLPRWHYHLIDVESLAVGYLMGMHEDQMVDLRLPWKSDELSKAIGVEPPNDDERHTALGDALWAKRTYDKVMGIG